jgi:hypothetical protein
MDAKAWNLEDRWAKLRLGKLAATVDLLEPARGLHELWVNERPWHAARLLEVGIGAAVATQLDAYVREKDLVVTYEQTDARPFRAQVYWRALPCTHGASAAIELVLSVQTSLWDSDPGLTVGSIVPGSECLRLVKVEEQLVERLAPAASHGQHGDVSWAMSKQALVESFNGTGCFLFRAPQTDVTYVEMVHPVDFSCSLLDAQPQGLERHFEIRHRLFVQRLEKGVILRARVRAAFLPRQDDVAAAAALYQEFAAAEPPLTA